MAPEKKNTEAVIPMVDDANKNVIDFAVKEDAEADRIFYEHQGLQADGITPLGEEIPKEDKPEGEPEVKPEVKPEGEPKTEDLEKGMPKKEEKPEGEPKTEDDLTKDLTTENANKRISAAQNKMHTSNKTAKEAVEKQNSLQKENDDLRKIIDEKTAKDPDQTEDGKTKEKEQTPDEVDSDLEKLRVEYPEIAEPMIKMMQKQNAENKVLRDRLDIVDEREIKRETDAETTKQNTHLDAIKKAHPDFHEISQEPLLDEWIEGLPAMERVGAKAIKSGGSTPDVISLLTTFKEANGYKVPSKTEDKTTVIKADSKLNKAKKQVTPQFNKAKEINTQDKQIRFTQEQISKWSEKEWAKNEKAVDEAMALGLVR